MSVCLSVCMWDIDIKNSTVSQFKNTACKCINIAINFVVAPFEPDLCAAKMIFLLVRSSVLVLTLSIINEIAAVMHKLR